MPPPMPTDPRANSPLERMNSGLGFIRANSRAPALPSTGKAYWSQETAPGAEAAGVGGGANSTAPWGTGGGAILAGRWITRELMGGGLGGWEGLGGAGV